MACPRTCPITMDGIVTLQNTALLIISSKAVYFSGEGGTRTQCPIAMLSASQPRQLKQMAVRVVRRGA